jgi:hypothetical protein
MGFHLSKIGRGLLATGAAAVLGGLAAVPALASGGPAAPSDYGFVVKLTIGTPGTDDARACTGALVRPRVVVTASNCLVTTAHPDPASASALPITARFPSGATVSATDVRTSVVPGVSAVVLGKPVQATVALATTAATSGESLTAAGFGRTAADWVTDQAHTAAFTVASADGSGIALTPTGDAGLCRGDAGAPLVRTGSNGKPELVALATGAHQKGCLGSADTSGDATATDAVVLAALPAATTDLLDQLTLSPLDSARANVAGANFGTTVATGDFNKDGFQDFAVGAPQGLGGSDATIVSGTVTVFMGSANGPGAGRVLSQADFGAGDETGDLFGSSLATGDFNKDGYADLAIGTPGETIGTVKAGAAAAYYGSATGLGKPVFFDQSDTGQTDVAGDGFGSSMAAGDFNGDGYADVAIGVPSKVISGARSGQVEILKGSSTGLSRTSPYIVSQTAVSGATNESGDLFGTAVAAGNVLGAKTGTVYADLVVGAPGESPGSDPQSGIVYVIPGSASGPVSGGISASQTGNSGSNEAGDRFGAKLATGDFNKDGWADVVVGVPGESPGTDPQSGSAIVMGGGNTALIAGYTVQQQQFTGVVNAAGDLFGSSFATGDVNGDGYADLIAGAPGRSGAAGAVYTWLGGAVSTARPNSLTPGKVVRQQDVYDTDEAGDRFGAALATADFTKDGKADALVGRPGESAPGQPASGAVTMLTGLAGS